MPPDAALPVVALPDAAPPDAALPIVAPPDAALPVPVTVRDFAVNDGRDLDGYRAFGRVRAAVKVDLRELYLEPRSLVLVGCSGGADSLALAGALAAENREVGRTNRRRGFPIRVGAVVVDHGLQLDSAEVAQRAAEQCRALGIDPVEVVRVQLPADGGNEDQARAARYQALSEAAGRLGASAVYLGHTLDDQAETVLLGLARGSGTRSLAGMRAVNGIYRRPLLGLRRLDTAATCEFLGLRPWQDPANSGFGDGAPLRSRVRREVLPVLEDVLGPSVAVALARTADLAREDADVLDDLAEELFAKAVDSALSATPSPAMTHKKHSGGQAQAEVHASFCGPVRGAQNPSSQPRRMVLDASTFAQAPAPVRRRVLRLAALAAGSPAGSLTARHLAALDSLVANWRGQGPTYLPSGVRVQRACGRLYFCPVKES